MIRRGEPEYDWDIDLGAGRDDLARRLHHPGRLPRPHPEAYDAATSPDHAAGGPRLRRGARPRRRTAWRRVVAGAATRGIPAPGFSSALAYYDGLRAERLPAALIQGLRDFFGAHTYRRIDRDGAFHTLWSGDRTEAGA